jgi:hypothetical protein
MADVTRIDWTIQTGPQWWSGTDDTVKIEILRDDNVIKRLNLEPGDTPRLDRNEFVTYYWIFQHPPDGIAVAVSGTPVPYTESFPAGLSKHLRVRFIAKGDDAWEALDISSTVYTGRLRGIPGTQAVEWVEELHDFQFPGRDVLSTDRSEGVTTLTLNY